MPDQTFLTIALSLGIAMYFSVAVVRALAAWVLFARVRSTALLTWPRRPPPHFALLVVMGVVAAAVAVRLGALDRPFPHVYSQSIMALYFVAIVPLLRRIPLGLYRDGVWTATDFLPWGRIGRMAFREGPEIVLILLPRGDRAQVLPVPVEEYAAVRKVIEQKRRERVVNVDDAILGLD